MRKILLAIAAAVAAVPVPCALGEDIHPDLIVRWHLFLKGQAPRPALNPGDRLVVEVSRQTGDRAEWPHLYEIRVRSRNGRWILVARDGVSAETEIDAPPDALVEAITFRGRCASAPGIGPLSGTLEVIRLIAEAQAELGCWTREPLGPGATCGSLTVVGTCTEERRGRPASGLALRVPSALGGVGGSIEVCLRQSERTPRSVVIRSAAGLAIRTEKVLNHELDPEAYVWHGEFRRDAAAVASAPSGGAPECRVSVTPARR